MGSKLAFMNRKVILISFLLQILAGQTHLYANGDNRAVIVSYIYEYKDIAIAEMHRTGIPASIKLAQAVLESNAGRSYLAREGNNHFGIKCGSAWSGESVYRKDDDYDRNGKLMQSCFRSYSDPAFSFVSHSDFLTDPRKAYRYGFLFDLDKTDYKAWAHGLKKAGYATNPRYATLLINVIHSYNLQEFDYVENVPKEVVEAEELIVEAQAEFIPEEKETRQTFFLMEALESYSIAELNKVSYIKADYGDTPENIALEMGIQVETLLQYNDHIYKADSELDEGTIIYLEHKRRKFKGSLNTHHVTDEESMEGIAQEYAIKLKQLYRKNRMKEGTQPAQGEQIYLRGRRPKNSIAKLRPPTRATSKEPSGSDSGQEVPAPSLNPNPPIQPREETPLQEIETIQPETVIHVVQQGETLYAISRLYDLTVTQLKVLNNLTDNVIKPGQELKVK